MYEDEGGEEGGEGKEEEEERRVGRRPGVPALTWRGVTEREDWEESPSAYASTAEASSASISPLWRPLWRGGPDISHDECLRPSDASPWTSGIDKRVRESQVIKH